MPFAPSPAEVAIVNQIFVQADPQKLGLVTGEQGIKVFAGAKLPPATLGDIWAIADPENNGALTRKGVAITVRLIGWAQNGETPSSELLEKGISNFPINLFTSQMSSTRFQLVLFLQSTGLPSLRCHPWAAELPLRSLLSHSLCPHWFQQTVQSSWVSSIRPTLMAVSSAVSPYAIRSH
jgi:hypothetical protein